MTLERDIPALLASGRITQEDADAVADFRAFLVDIGPRHASTRNVSVPTWAMWKHRRQLGMTGAEVRAVAERRGESWPVYPDEATDGRGVPTEKDGTA